MPKPTAEPANNRGLCGMGGWPQRQGERFEQHFNAWLKARSELAELDAAAATADNEDEIFEVGQRVEDAARLAMTTHAPLEWMVWKKVQILEDALHGTGDCEWRDHRQVWMLACIKADLMHHGIGRMP